MIQRPVKRCRIGEVISVAVTLPPGLDVSEVPWHIESTNGGTAQPMRGQCQATSIDGRVVFTISFKSLTPGDLRIYCVVNGSKLSAQRTYRVEDKMPPVGALSRNLPTSHEDPFSAASQPEVQTDEEASTDPDIERRDRWFFASVVVFGGLCVLLVGFFLWRIFFLYPSF